MSVSSPTDALVSICITSYNYGRFISDAIESALAQTYPHIEVVISDNASTDNTHEVLAAYAQHPRVKVFVNDTNVGLCKNHNLAITRSTGTYIVVLSADDILFPTHVDMLMQRMLDPLDPVRIVHAQGLHVDEALRVICALVPLGSLPIAYSRRDDFGNILFFYHHLYPAKLIARSVYDEVGLFNENVKSLIDIELAARMEQADIPSAFVPAFVAALRIHGERTSSYARDQTNVWIHDKLHMVELGLRPENAWRIEGYEAYILAVIDIELQRLASQGAEPLNAHESQRLLHVRSEFALLTGRTPAWPQCEPQLSVIVVTDGAIALLQATLDTVSTQQLERTEIIIVQTSGWDVSPWVARLPYAATIRVIQARACDTIARAFRYGLDLARGEYVTYVSEGQRIGDRHYQTMIAYLRGVDARMAVVPKASVDDSFRSASLPELHATEFPDAATRARLRSEGEAYSLCQILHRRAILRGGSHFYEIMPNCDEAAFVAQLAGSFTTVTLALQAEEAPLDYHESLSVSR